MYLSLARRYLLPGMIVIDAGCGDGNFAASLHEAGLHMHGLDLSAGGIAKAQLTWSKIPFVVGSIYDDMCAPFNLAPVDAVVSIEVIEHLYSPRQFVQRAFEALKPGGIFIVTTPYWGYAKNLLLAVTNRTDRALTALWEGGHIKHWSYHTLRTLLEDGGFEFVAFHGAGIGIRAVPGFWSGMLMVARKI